MNKKMIIFDIDETLVDNKNKCIWPSTIKALKKLKENGHDIVIASGRNTSLLFTIEKIKKYIDHYVLINGQQILVNGKSIYDNIIDKADLTKIIEDFNKHDIPYGQMSATDVYMNKRNEDVDYSYSLFGLDEPKIDKDYYLKEEIYQIWCFCDFDKVEKVSKNHLKYKFISWGSYGFDVLPQDTSKARSIKILADYLGIDMADTIAFGDGLNDIEMIKECGIGVAMGNANIKLKEVADYITDDISKDGVYKALEHFKLL